MDPIANMFNMIKNAQAVNKSTVKVPFSRLKHEIAKKMVQIGALKKVTKKGEKPHYVLELELQYIELNKDNDSRIPRLSILKRVSKPGKRVYSGTKQLRTGAYEILLLSTPRGILTDKEAKKFNTGGEVLAKIR